MAGPFVSNGGGAAFGNPNVTRQGTMAGAQQATTSSAGQQYGNMSSNAGYGRGNAQLHMKMEQGRQAAAAAKPKPPPPKPAADNQPKETPKKGPKATGGFHQFPSDFVYQYCMMLRFAPYDRDTVFQDESKDHDLFIALPMPTNLGESFGVNVGKQSFGAFMGEIGKVINDTINNKKSGQDLSQSLSSAIANSIKETRESGNLTNLLASRLAGGLGETAAAGVDMMLGTTPNPNLAVNFQGVPLRTFGFSWRFAPRSEAESQELIDIIFKLKQRMLPGKEKFILTYPDHCEISVHSNQSALRELIKFKTSFLTDVKVNYAPSGVPSFFASTTMPTEIELSLTFQETKIFTREDFMNPPKIQTSAAGAPPAVQRGGR